MTKRVMSIRKSLLYRVCLLVLVAACCQGQEYRGQCDKLRNANLPFCNPSLSIDERVRDLVSRLTLAEKIVNLVDEAAGAQSLVDIDPYNWWNEGLKGVAESRGVHFRPPTEVATVFPQPINLASSFNKQLFLEMGNVTGNEGRTFYNSGNAGMTFWSPNINIYRDPRWGRGHETPGEDPHLSSQFAHGFIQGLQEPRNGFLKTSACCKHFSAHSQEEDRFTFNSIVTPRDMADTYLPTFKSCVQQSDVSCIMCAYNAVHGIPACADKGLLTGLVREEWGFDGYITSDCGAVTFVYTEHNYTERPAETCLAVLDAGMDIECNDIFGNDFLRVHLPEAVQDGTVPVTLIDDSLSRGYRVLMRLGHFEKEETRPFKELVPDVIDNLPSRDLALKAARQSIVLLKNQPNSKTGKSPLPLDENAFKSKQATMALIGPHLNASRVFLGNYYGIPSFIKTPLEEIQGHVGDLEYEYGCDISSFNDSRLQAAEDLAGASTSVVLLVGIDAERVERESADRPNITLPGLQNELIRRVVSASQEPVILVVVSGGAIDLEEWENNPKVGAILHAGYLGQSGGEAIADVIFGVYNPSGRLPQTFYKNDYLAQVPKGDMNMRPSDDGTYPGRTYRFYTGTPVYEFGFGLSYTTFEYSWVDPPGILSLTGGSGVAQDCELVVRVNVQNIGERAGDHSVLAFLAPPNAGEDGQPIKSLKYFDRVDNVEANEGRVVELCFNRGDFELSNEEGEFELITGQWMLKVGDLERGIMITIMP